MQTNNKGYLFIFFTSICFGINTLFLRSYYLQFHNESPQNVAFWGMFGSVIIVMPFFLFSKMSRQRISISVRRDGRLIFVIAVLSTLATYLWLVGLQKLSAGPVSLISKSQIIFSAVIGAIFLKERFTLFEIMGIFLAIAGVVLISTLGEEVALDGIFLILFSELLFSFQSMLVKKYAPDLSGIEFTLLRAILMVIFYFIIFYLRGELDFLPYYRIFYLSAATVFGLMIGRALYYEAHKYLEISKLSTGMLFEPVFVLIASFLLLGEVLSLKKMEGSFLILLGLWMTARKNIQLEMVPKKIRKLL